MQTRLLVTISIAIVLVAAGCSTSSDEPTATSSDDPAAVLEDYQNTRNSGDVEGVLALYAQDAVVLDHPLDTDGTATGVEEIRELEKNVPGVQRDEDAIEFIDIEVSGNVATFNHKFFNSSGGCTGYTGNTVTVENGEITQYDWGQRFDEMCR